MDWALLPFIRESTSAKEAIMSRPMTKTNLPIRTPDLFNTRWMAALLFLSALLWSGSAFAAPTALDGRIKVNNQRHVPSDVTIDGERIGRVSAGSSRVFENIPNGVRMVSLSSLSGFGRKAQLNVPVRGTAVIKLAPLTGKALIRNRSDVSLRIFVAGQNLGVLKKGQSVKTPSMVYGRYKIIAKPVSGWASGGIAMVKNIDIKVGESTRVSLGKWSASVKVTNDTAFGVVLFMNGTRVSRLKRGDTILVDNQLPGRHTLSIRKKGGVVASTQLEVAPGSTGVWAPRHVAVRPAFAPGPKAGAAGKWAPIGKGKLTVKNRASQPLAVTLGGKKLGKLAPGQKRTFNNIPAGSYKLVGRYATGKSERMQVEIQSGKTTIMGLKASRPIPTKIAVFSL